ncbi:TauD/TfdA family dioxygenase [Streptomyces cyaneofuscatus]|uniref:TauD/TfdA family dioxygenase n=1 Tax=Streptomyces cyaneofuscatus TaxID=66883 RepID=UPI003803DC08
MTTATTAHEIRRVGPRIGAEVIGVDLTRPVDGATADHLLRHASSPDYTIRFGWNPGDFVLWDNQATWHYAVDDNGDGARVYRKVIGVESPQAQGPCPAEAASA